VLEQPHSHLRRLPCLLPRLAFQPGRKKDDCLPIIRTFRQASTVSLSPRSGATNAASGGLPAGQLTGEGAQPPSTFGARTSISLFGAGPSAFRFTWLAFRFVEFKEEARRDRSTTAGRRVALGAGPWRSGGLQHGQPKSRCRDITQDVLCSSHRGPRHVSGRAAGHSRAGCGYRPGP
jgi:hypothetical protein